eukprot:PhF_6_TR21905/c0_g2_i1/m.31108
MFKEEVWMTETGFAKRKVPVLPQHDFSTLPQPNKPSRTGLLQSCQQLISETATLVQQTDEERKLLELRNAELHADEVLRQHYTDEAATVLNSAFRGCLLRGHTKGRCYVCGDYYDLAGLFRHVSECELQVCGILRYPPHQHLPELCEPIPSLHSTSECIEKYNIAVGGYLRECMVTCPECGKATVPLGVIYRHLVRYHNY